MQAISWDHLNEYISKGIPAQLPVTADSENVFLIADGGTSLGLRLPAGTTNSISPSPYAELEIYLVHLNGTSVIELKTFSSRLYKTFYRFSLDIVEQLELESVLANEAIENSLENWMDLLVQRSLMSESKQIGLVGELSLLCALIASKGPDAFAAWTGPIGEPHDFRLEVNEIEVKSTRLAKRTHRIHGLDQLEPSKGMQLSMLSLQFEPAGNSSAGRSLVDRVSEIRELLRGFELYLAKFESYIARLGYKDADSALYLGKLTLRSIPHLIPITQDFPRLTKAMVAQAVSGQASNRIEYVEYDLCVDGMGYEEGTLEFKILTGGIKELE
jgi:hypothetical protein